MLLPLLACRSSASAAFCRATRNWDASCFPRRSASVEVLARSKGADVEVVDVVVPDPGPGEALIRHTAIGFNFVDT